jgi:hypothetical protein
MGHGCCDILCNVDDGELVKADAKDFENLGLF